MAPPPPRLAQQSSSSTTAGSSTTTLEQSTILPIRQANPTLVLRAEPLEQRRIQWAEDVVDNEGMGKKSSKGMDISASMMVS
jgi:protein phosphatase 1 regulatory subunit 11